MLPGRQPHGAEHVVGPETGGFRAVDVGRPAVGVEDLGEYRHALCGGGVFVLEVVGTVFREGDGAYGCRVGGGRRPALRVRLVFFCDYGGSFQVGFPEQVDLLLRAPRHGDRVDEPGGAVGRRAEHRFGLSAVARHDQVARVEHVQNGVVAVAQVAVDQILVTGQLGAVVAAHGAVEIGGRSVLEGADREVEDAEPRLLVGHDRLVGGRGRDLVPARRNEVVVRNEPQVDRHQVEQHHGGEQCREHVFVDPAQGEQRHAARCEQDHQQRAPCVGLHHGGAFGRHGIARGDAHLGIHAALEVILHVVGLEQLAELFGHHPGAFRAAEIEERAAGDGQQQAEPARDARGPCQCPQQPLARDLPAPQPHECQCSQQRHGPLDDDERHRDGAELVIAGQQVEGQFGEPHQVASPCQQEHQHRDGDDPPFVASACQGDAQRCEENGRGAQVGRAAGVGLAAPVGRQLLCGAAQPVFVQHGCHLAVGREGRGRFAPHEVGDQQVQALRAAVAPGRGVVERQPVLRSLGGRGQFGAAAHGLFGVAGGVPQGREIRPCGEYACGGEYRRAFPEVPEAFVPQGRDALADPEGGHGQEEIVGDLRVVGADFERRRERRERPARPHVSPQGHPRTAHHQRGIDQRPHLGDVPGAYDQQEIGREPVGQRRDDADPGVDAEDEQHQPHGRHGEEEERRGRVDEFHDLPHGAFDDLRGVGHVDQEGGHAAEHAARPLGVFARGRAHVADVLCHAFVLHHVVLGQYFAAELRGEIGRAHYEEDDERRRSRRQPAYDRFRKIHFPCR